MILLSTTAGLFGPYARCERLPDRIRTWPLGSAPDARGADLPLSVIGAAEELEVDVPAGFSADAFTWDGADLVPNNPPADAEPIEPIAE
jgi:hypothetical protein